MTPIQIIRQNMSKLTAAEHIEVLGWYLDRDRDAPLSLPDAVDDELLPVAHQFRFMYSSIVSAADGSCNDGNDAWQNEADYRYDDSRSAAA